MLLEVDVFDVAGDDHDLGGIHRCPQTDLGGGGMPSELNGITTIEAFKELDERVETRGGRCH